MIPAAECVQHCTVAREYLSVVTDPAHLLAEATWELLTAIPIYFVAKPLIRRHDRHKHGGK